MSALEPNREVARTALEQVCSRGDMTLATLLAGPRMLRALRDGR